MNKHSTILEGRVICENITETHNHIDWFQIPPPTLLYIGCLFAIICLTLPSSHWQEKPSENLAAHLPKKTAPVRDLGIINYIHYTIYIYVYNWVITNKDFSRMLQNDRSFNILKLDNPADQAVQAVQAAHAVQAVQAV